MNFTARQMASTYRLERLPRVRTQLRKLPPDARKEVAAILAHLADTPFPDYAEPLRSPYEHIWKIKIGMWRLFYRVHDKEKVITVLTIKRRDRNTYTRMFSILF